MYKYPRTPHIEGSRLQPGDEDLDSVPFSVIASQYVTVEEKVALPSVPSSVGSQIPYILIRF